MAKLNEFMRFFENSMIERICLAQGEPAMYARGESFVQEGQICRYVGVIKEGYFKFCSLSSAGDECVTGFSFAGELVTDYPRSFANLRPSFGSIVAGCDATVFRMPLKKLRQLLIDSNPKLLSEYSAVLLEEAYRRYIDMHIMSPSERYAALLERFPALASELPVGEVASYLGISRRHLHRIREGKC